VETLFALVTTQLRLMDHVVKVLSLCQVGGYLSQALLKPLSLPLMTMTISMIKMGAQTYHQIIAHRNLEIPIAQFKHAVELTASVMISTIVLNHPSIGFRYY